MAETTRDFVCTATLDGLVQFVNRAGRQCIGVRDTAGPAATPIATYLHPDDRGLVADLLTEVVTQGAQQRSRIRFHHQQTGEVIPLSCHLFRLRRQQGSEPLTAAIVGRPHENEQTPPVDPARTPDVAGLTRLSEMFAGIVGHDLRNPLNAILTCAHFVIHQSQDEATKTTLGRIISSGHRMQRMIDQLLDLTRIRAGSGIPLHVTSIDLAALAQQAAQEVASGNGGTNVIFEATGEATGAWDADRIAQMISNLVGNAVQHGEHGKDVRVTVDATSPGHVMLTVHNHGAIPPEFLPVLFNPFRIVHQKRHKSTGLGLGLYVSRQIALAHGGDIEVTSTEEAGTSLRVRLPRARPDMPPVTATSGLGADDMAILEMLATAPKATSVTAQLFGAVALHERAPQEYWRLFERYARLLDVALDRHTYKVDDNQLSIELREIAEQLGRLGAGAREVAELHARALRQKTQAVNLAKAQAFTTEGRLVSFELMGHLLSFYRRRSGLAGADA